MGAEASYDRCAADPDHHLPVSLLQLQEHWREPHTRSGCGSRDLQAMEGMAIETLICVWKLHKANATKKLLAGIDCAFTSFTENSVVSSRQLNLFS